MEIPIIDPSDIVMRRETKGLKYGKYVQAMASEIQWIKAAIASSSDGKIRIKIRDIAKSMGPEFEKKQNKAIYWGTRFILFLEGIVVGPGKDKANEELLIMRMATSEDVLPRSLAKFLDPSNYNRNESSFEES